jgi:LmbE family N-acetylglucosaminyl deacetylase
LASRQQFWFFMKKIIFTLFYTIVACYSYAQQVRPANAGKIHQEIAQLRHLVNVLYVAAHPDDENTRLLAWLVNTKNVRTSYLSLTRGDGGQNIIGSEQGDALGLIRTHELMEARKIDGAGQFFSRAIDFGFSKNYQETFKHWPEDSLVSDVVWVMRKFRPDVVICRFPPDSNAGHGHHAASAIIAAQAFRKAGDGAQYPWQLKYYSPWQPKRLLQNTYRFGDRNTTSEDQFKVKVGEYIPALGMGSGELAGVSRSVHKSQGAGTPGVPGVQIEYFKLVDGDNLSESLFDGIDISWGRVGRADIGDDLKDIETNYDFQRPDASIPALLAVRKKIETVTDDYWRNEKMDELNKVVLDCSGFMAELYTKQPQAVRGATLPFTLHLVARSHTPVIVSGIQWESADQVTMLPFTTATYAGARPGNNKTIELMPVDTLLTFEQSLHIPENEPFTQPYWLKNTHRDAALFSIPEDTLLGLPETPDNLNALLHLYIGGADFTVKIPLSYKKLDPVKGDVVEQLRIVPAATLAFSNTLLIAKPNGAIEAAIRIHAYREITSAKLEVKNARKEYITSIDNLSLNAGGDTLVPVNINKAIVSEQGKDDFYLMADLAIMADNIGTTVTSATVCDQSLHLVQYSHIPTLQYFTPATAKVIRPDWKCTAKRIGYIEGAGDLVPAFLREAGIEVDILKEGDLTDANKLKKYDAIVTGIRAVNVEKRMAYWLPVLFQYVRNGGNLVMQYNTLQDLSTTNIGPYPFTLANLRVTEEDAHVGFVDPTHALLNYPNKLSDSDFNGWVQERGLYFASKWDDRYQPVFEMHDAGEQPLKGSTLYAKVGKGNYIYTTLSFSRQLPAGNKGAIRLFMNMLSKPKG